MGPGPSCVCANVELGLHAFAGMEVRDLLGFASMRVRAFVRLLKHAPELHASRDCGRIAYPLGLDAFFRMTPRSLLAGFTCLNRCGRVTIRNR